MTPLILHQCHAALGASFVDIRGMEGVNTYGNPLAEYQRLKSTTAVLDLSFRGRLCLLGSDRKKFLHGQITNRVMELQEGQGCYAALISAKGRMQSDLHVHCLADELLLDFEPGLTTQLMERLDKYIIAEDVQVVNVQEPYGLISLQGPGARTTLEKLSPSLRIPGATYESTRQLDPNWGEIYCVNLPRFGSAGFDLFAPAEALESLHARARESAESTGGGLAGWNAMETVRIEASIPRYGADMDDTNLPPEAGLESRAIHYAKGCYIGQEVMARLRTYGQVAKALRGLRLAPDAKVLPQKGDRIVWGDKEIGHVTSATASPTLRTNVVLAYLRRERFKPGDTVTIRTPNQEIPAEVATLPFEAFRPGPCP
ncbi:MAG: aminomethyl transferase family protein [Verrucomicrobia bacterium]|nr:aminomethyl transferase family protein [Verrucomicrobiota bacterium]